MRRKRFQHCNEFRRACKTSRYSLQFIRSEKQFLVFTSPIYSREEAFIFSAGRSIFSVIYFHYLFKIYKCRNSKSDSMESSSFTDTYDVNYQNSKKSSQARDILTSNEKRQKCTWQSILFNARRILSVTAFILQINNMKIA